MLVDTVVTVLDLRLEVAGQSQLLHCRLRGWRPLNGRPGLRMAVWLPVKVRG